MSATKTMWAVSARDAYGRIWHSFEEGGDRSQVYSITESSLPTGWKMLHVVKAAEQ